LLVEQDGSRKQQVVDFLTFALQHIPMLRKVAQKSVAVTLLGPAAISSYNLYAS
jgi:hypothetical protein